jgi:hypothetical protein
MTLPLLLCALLAAAPVDPAASPPRTITVTGDAEVHVPADEVQIVLGVEVFESKADAARSEVEQKVRDIFTAAKAVGVDPKRMQTEMLTLEPRYVNYDQKKIEGYTARTTATLCLKDTARWSDLMSGAFKAGANVVRGVSFRTDKLRQHRDAARKMAAQAAREKADLLATALGAKVGRPMTISEGYDTWSNAPSYNSNNVAQNAMQSAGSSQGSDDLQPGQVSVSAKVSVVFELQ